MSSRSTMCQECARDFEYEPSPKGGRPPTRCRRCKSDHEAVLAEKQKRQAEAPRAKKWAALVPTEDSPRVQVNHHIPAEPKLASALHPQLIGLTAEPPGYVQAFKDGIRAEIAQLEETLTQRRALLAAVEGYV